MSMKDEKLWVCDMIQLDDSVKDYVNFYITYENHHPEHFREIKSMDEDSISEMVANWMAIAYANHEPYDYYWKNVASKKYDFTQEQKTYIKKKS